MADPYETLGVSKTATADEIRTAYRKAAKRYHPDLHPGDAAAENHFKAVNAANGLLSDSERRGQFDRGEIDAEGAPVIPDRPYYRDYAAGSGGARYAPGAAGTGDTMDPEAFGDIFGSFFRDQARDQARRGQARPRRGRDRQYRLDVAFVATVIGATERLTLPDGATLDVRIPPGLEDGQVLRLRGKGEAGAQGAPAGDALISVSVLPHPFYRRQGADLELDLPVTVAEAVLGGKVPVPTPQGTVSLTIPARSDTGARLRLRGRGVAAHGSQGAGDLFVVLKLVTGPVDAALEEFLRGWAPGHTGYDPRAGMPVVTGGDEG